MVKKTLLIFAFVFIHPIMVWAASIGGDFSTSLVSHWELEETSSTRLDSTASNNDLTANGTGGVGYNTGVQGNAADFERSENDFLSITDAAQTGLDLSGDFSMSFWVNFESTITGQYNIVGKDGNGANNTRSYDVWLTNTGIQVVIFPTGYTYPGYYNATDTYTWSTATWYHVVVTCDISETSKVKWYVNGADQGYLTLVDGTGATSIQNSAATVQIGYQSFSGGFDGLLDELSVWDGRILNSTEVSTIYNSANGIPYTAAGGGSTAAPTAPGLNFFE